MSSNDWTWSTTSLTASGITNIVNTISNPSTTHIYEDLFSNKPPNIFNKNRFGIRNGDNLLTHRLTGSLNPSIIKKLNSLQRFDTKFISAAGFVEYMNITTPDGEINGIIMEDLAEERALHPNCHIGIVVTVCTKGSPLLHDATKTYRTPRRDLTNSTHSSFASTYEYFIILPNGIFNTNMQKVPNDHIVAVFEDDIKEILLGT